MPKGSPADGGRFKVGGAPDGWVVDGVDVLTFLYKREAASWDQ